MPMKPKRPCGHPGCNQFTESGFCPEHQVIHDQQKAERNSNYNEQRGNASKRGYDIRWQKVRNTYLSHHPICEACLEQGRYRAAVLVHHVTPISEGGEKLRFDNLRALCVPCHEKIHGADRFRRRKPPEG